MIKRLLYIVIVIAGLSSCAHAEKHQRVEPLPVPADILEMSDCTVPARFSYDDFNWRGSSLRMKVYSMDLYDAVEVQRLAKGDTIVWEGEPVCVISAERDQNGYVVLDVGFDGFEPVLAPMEGGTYRGAVLDDHATYTFVGEEMVMVSDDFVIRDCGEFPDDPMTVVTEGQKAYLESLPEWRREFYVLNTTVVVENGYVTEIIRKWIP